jgi:S-formylglutathione hydrolase FrmB
MRRLYLLFSLIVSVLYADAGTVDTVTIYSKAMGKSYRCVVVRPEQYTSTDTSRFPAVYLLHGYGGNFSNWITRVPELSRYADRYRFLIICPEGLNSWYLDSPMDSTLRFETYVSSEVPDWIDQHYRTIPNRSGRAITGLSMGGHGGLFLGFRHTDRFGACGSMSGGVDLRPFPTKWNLRDRLGDTLLQAANWKTYSVLNVVERIPADTPAVIIDCGSDDFFFAVNEALHEKLMKLRVPHDYVIRPGGHNWKYWQNAVRYQLYFFNLYFDRPNAPALGKIPRAAISNLYLLFPGVLFLVIQYHLWLLQRFV